MDPDCLAHLMSGMFHGAVANRRHTNLYIYTLVYKLCIGAIHINYIGAIYKLYIGGGWHKAYPGKDVLPLPVAQ